MVHVYLAFYALILLDWFTKEIVGYSFSFQSKPNDWLDALNMAVNHRFPNGIKEDGNRLSLITDNGCQPTSERSMRICADLTINQMYNLE